MKIGKVLNFCHFRGHFWVIMGSFPSFPKKSKNLYKYISHGTKLMSVEFCECTSSYYVNNISWQILLKKPVRFKYFPSPYEIWAENIKSEQKVTLKLSKIDSKLSRQLSEERKISQRRVIIPHKNRGRLCSIVYRSLWGLRSLLEYEKSRSTSTLTIGKF